MKKLPAGVSFSFFKRLLKQIMADEEKRRNYTYHDIETHLNFIFKKVPKIKILYQFIFPHHQIL